jgi:P-type Ca2+ transporter type 2C
MDDSAIAAMMSKGAVVARSQPVDKLRIVQALSAFGHVVMVTGDGVNDAPALRAAAVGVAMGRAGSDVARQAADVVLTNDSFATLVESIREGRRLIANFNKAICFYLAVKLALILVSAAAAILGHPLPFTPVQIVILELFMDLGAALAFVSQPADEDVMRIPPRDPNAPFFTRSLIQGIVCGGFTLALLVFAVFQYGLTHFGLDSARTLALISWFVGHAVIGLTMAGGQGVTNLKHILANRVLLIWFGTSVMFAALIAVVETISTFLGGEAVPLAVAAACALVSLIVPLWLNVFRLGNGVAR